MPAKISREKESKIVRLHLQKVSQTKIAQEVDASQSTVSATISRFKKDASNTSLDAAGYVIYTLTHLVLSNKWK